MIKDSNNILLRILVFTILFLILSKVLFNFQLNGINDNGWYINLISSLYNNLSFYVSIDGGYNYLGSHFSPFWILFSPLLYFIKDPIILLNIMFYFGYLFIFLALVHIIQISFKKKISTYANVLIFLMLFSSVTILFNYSLNVNGIHEVIFAVPFILISSYYLFNSHNYTKVLLWYYPTLLIKEEFWLLIIFIYIAIFIKSINYKYLIGAILHLILFYILYFIFMKYVYINSLGISANIDGIHSSFYAYLFNSNSIGEIIDNIFNLSQMKKRILLIMSFFFPFIFLVKWNKIILKDMFLLLILISPTIGYSFLSQHFGMTNFLFDHYSFPIIGILFAFILKYLNLSKISIVAYILSNVFLVGMILYNKQPWQYKSYQDELQLNKNIKPLLDLSKNTFAVMDDKTALYFSYKNVDYIASTMYHNTKVPIYIVMNLRYMYNAKYLNNYHKSKNPSSQNIINNIKYLDKHHYGIIYLNYPFIIFKKDINTNLSYDRKLLNIWDTKTIKSNKWM